MKQFRMTRRRICNTSDRYKIYKRLLDTVWSGYGCILPGRDGANDVLKNMDTNRAEAAKTVGDAELEINKQNLKLVDPKAEPKGNGLRTVLT